MSLHILLRSFNNCSNFTCTLLLNHLPLAHTFSLTIFHSNSASLYHLCYSLSIPLPLCLLTARLTYHTIAYPISCHVRVSTVRSFSFNHYSPNISSLLSIFNISTSRENILFHTSLNIDVSIDVDDIDNFDAEGFDNNFDGSDVDDGDGGSIDGFII